MFFNYFFDNIARFYFQNLSIQILIGTLSILTVFACNLHDYNHLTGYHHLYSLSQIS